MCSFRAPQKPHPAEKLRHQNVIQLTGKDDGYEAGVLFSRGAWGTFLGVANWNLLIKKLSENVNTFTKAEALGVCSNNDRKKKEISGHLSVKKSAVKKKQFQFKCDLIEFHRIVHFN